MDLEWDGSVPGSDVMLCVSPALPPAMRRPKWSSEDYVVLEHLHRGHSSTLYKARGGAWDMGAGWA